jgi:hypothetical protein
MERKNRLKISGFVFLMALLLPAAAQARAVSYAEGWMAMTMNDPWTNSAMLLYSPTATFALGPFVDHYRDTDGELAGLQMNWLAKRWNNRDSQGNLFVLSGLGAANDGGDINPGGYLGLEGDWEDRRYYVSYENRYTAAGEDVKDEFQQKARIGIAPYVAEAGHLHTWLMLQADHMPEDEDHWTVTPLVRLFKGAYLGEAGISNRGEFLFNFTATY